MYYALMNDDDVMYCTEDDEHTFGMTAYVRNSEITGEYGEGKTTYLVKGIGALDENIADLVKADNKEICLEEAREHYAQNHREEGLTIEWCRKIVRQ